MSIGGIRIEDDVLITEKGHKVLGKPIPKTVKEVNQFVPDCLLACPGKTSKEYYLNESLAWPSGTHDWHRPRKVIIF